MKLKIALAATLFASAFSTSAMAQASQCSDVLKDGIFQTQRFRDEQYFQQIIWSRFMRSDYKTAKEDKAFGFGVPVGEIILGGNFSESEFEAKKASMSKEYFDQVTATREIDVALSSADPDLLRVWGDCMKNQKGGLTIRFDPVTAREVFVSVEYFLQGTRNSVRLPKAVELPQGVTVKNGDCFKRNARFKAGKACQATLELDTATRHVLISMNADEASTTGFLPARVVLARQARNVESARLPNLQTTAFRSYHTPSHTVTLTDQEKALGWRFDPKSVTQNLVIDYKVYWSNMCESPYARATTEAIEYGFTIYTNRNRARNSSITCHLDVTAIMRRDAWLPQEDVPTTPGPGQSAPERVDINAPSIW